MSSYTGSTRPSVPGSFHSDSENDTPLARRSPEYHSYPESHRGRTHRHLSPEDDFDDEYARSPSLSSIHQFSFQQHSHIPSQRISDRSLSRHRYSIVDSIESDSESSSNSLETVALEAIRSVNIMDSNSPSRWHQRDRLQAMEPHPMNVGGSQPRHQSVPDTHAHAYGYQIPALQGRYHNFGTSPHHMSSSNGHQAYGGQQLPSLSSVVGDVLPHPIASSMISARPRGSIASAASVDSTHYSNSPPAFSVASIASPSLYQLSSSQPTRTYEHISVGISYDLSYRSHHSPEGSVGSTKADFRCPHQGCTVAPFTTQYLLNSHMNVHSSNRPHYCPHPGCPRGEGGEGFKRKNEMVRHSHIHMAPKYQCPFCKDQERKYPRPDNLQRHVRSRHPERSMDDPDLREVLSHRPDGHKKGRRRRTVHGA